MTLTTINQDKSVLASWGHSFDATKGMEVSDATIYAVRKNNIVSFEVEDKQTFISTVALKNIRGWISPEEVWDSDLSSFYEKFKLVKINESEWILALINKFVTVLTDTENNSRMIVSIENRIPSVFILSNKMLHTISPKNIKGIPEAIFWPIRGKITSLDIGRISKIENPKIIMVDLEEKAITFDTFRVFIVTFTTFALEIELTDTIKQIKQKIQDKENIAGHDFRMSTGTNLLEEDRMIFEYNIKQDSSLYFYPRLRGGGPKPIPFADLDAENEIRISLQRSGPPWRRVARGLNLLGICLNPNCNAYKQEVAIKKGFGVFDLKNKLFKVESPCPCCGKQVSEVNNCGFFKCIFSIEGAIKSQSGNPKEIKRVKVEAPNDRFLTFKAITTDSNSLLEYSYLKITTEPKPSNLLAIIPKIFLKNIRDFLRYTTFPTPISK